MEVTNSQFKEIIKKGLSLDLIFLLEKIQDKEDISQFQETKINNLVKTLERKNLIENQQLTTSGKELLNSIKESKESIVLKKLESKESEWEKFLKAYPARNKFVWKGKAFQGDRSIRKNTKDGHSLFIKILADGIKCDDLIKCVIAESLNKFESSYKTNQNKMNYFINTESWLRQKQYTNWLDEANQLTETEINQYYQAFNFKKNDNNKSTSFDI